MMEPFNRSALDCVSHQTIIWLGLSCHMFSCTHQMYVNLFADFESIKIMLKDLVNQKSEFRGLFNCFKNITNSNSQAVKLPNNCVFSNQIASVQQIFLLVYSNFIYKMQSNQMKSDDSIPLKVRWHLIYK